MSKPVKALIRDELTRRLDGITSLAIVGLTGVDAITATDIRKRLGEKEIRLLVVKNALARQAFKAGGLDIACDLLEGPCALAYGGDNVVSTVRELLDIKKEQAPNLVVKAAVMDGEAFPTDRIDALSKFPTREEAIAKVLSCALAPGMKAAACIIAPGSKIASLLKTIEENQEEEAVEEAPAEEAPAAEAPAEEAPAEEAPAAEAPAAEAPAEEAPAEEAPAEEAPAEEAPAEEAPAEEAPAEEAPAEEAPAEEAPAEEAPAEEAPAEEAPAEEAPAEEEKPE